MSAKVYFLQTLIDSHALLINIIGLASDAEQALMLLHLKVRCINDVELLCVAKFGFSQGGFLSKRTCIVLVLWSTTLIKGDFATAQFHRAQTPEAGT